MNSSFNLKAVDLNSSADVAHLQRAWLGIHPGWPLAVDDLRWRLSSVPGVALLLLGPGDVAGHLVLTAEGPAVAALDMGVLPHYRGQGLGEYLLGEARRRAPGLGAETLQIEVSVDSGDAIEWFSSRGFTEIERQEPLVLDLGGIVLAQPQLPSGVTLMPRAGRDELLRSMFECALEAIADIPGLDSDALPDWESWRAGEERPGRRHDLSVVAVADAEVIGYANLDVFDGKVGFHGLTGVRRAWRRGGIGRALKVRQIGLAKAAGLERLVTESQHDNEAMRRLNESLGYGPIPAIAVMQARSAR